MTENNDHEGAVEFGARGMLRTPQFYMLWTVFMFAGISGLMVIYCIKLFGIDALEHHGVAGAGPVILAVDNLPCELSLDASREFSRALAPYAGAIVRADYTAPFEALHLPEAVKRALILHQGAFTPGYGFMEKFIQKS